MKEHLSILTDEEIVQEIVQSRNPAMFEKLYERHVHKIYNKCLGFTQDSQSAEDLTHDIFLKTYLRLNSFKGDSKFYTWLYAIAYNYCVDYVNEKRKKESPHEDIEQVAGAEDPDEPSDDELFRIQIDRLRIILDRIPPDDRMMLLMKYQDDFTIEEMQNILQLGASAVKMRLKRAKVKVLEMYKKEFST